VAVRKRFIATLDIGSTKVLALLVEVLDGGVLKIAGYGMAACKGLRHGVPASMDDTVAAIESAIDQAEHSSGMQIQAVHVSVSGAQIASQNSTGRVIVSRNPRDTKSTVIQQKHINNVIEQASQSSGLPIEKAIIHSLRKDYVVDGVDGVINPLGINALKLECRVNTITMPVTVSQNLNTCVNRAGQNVESMTLSSLAAAEAVLKHDEKELGVMLVDIGASSCDLLIYSEGYIQHAATVDMGGADISRDISMAFRTPHQETENIKQRFGCCFYKQIVRDEKFSIETIGSDEPTPASRSQLCQVIQPRMEEILESIEAELVGSGMRHLLGAGIVFTGGGALLDGLLELCSEHFMLPVRIGDPSKTLGLKTDEQNTLWTTAIGVAAWQSARQGEKKRVAVQIGSSVFKHVSQRFASETVHTVDAI
jgi:cell division protein FtsA